MGGRVGMACRRTTLLIATFAAGVACGLTWGKLRGDGPAPPSYEIRGGRKRLTNPLLECEVAGNRFGRELRPFKQALAELIQRQQLERRAVHVSLYFRDLDNGPWLGIDENQLYTPASLFKVPLIMAALKQADHDPALLRREVPFQGFADGSLLEHFQSAAPLVVGRTYRVEELVARAASASDNHAAALLGNVIDRGVLRRLLNDLGLQAELADKPEMQASVSPRSYGHLFRVLYNASYLDQDSSERALEFFANSTFKDGLEAGVPPGTTVAHKFGTYARDVDSGGLTQLHDCGIVYAPSRPYFLCIMTAGADEALLAGVIAEISRFVYDEIDRQSKVPAGDREDPPTAPP